MEHFEKMRLCAGKNLITYNPRDAFRVESGAVLVYIVSLHSKGVGRRIFLYEAHIGEIIPAFSYTDLDNTRLCFCLLSGNAEISVMPGFSTKVLRQRFAEKAQIKNFTIEGYNEALAEKYRFLTVIDEVNLKRRDKNKENVSSGIVSEITDVFSKKKKCRKNTDLPLYNAVSLICNYSDIMLIGYDEVKKAGYSDPRVDDLAALSGFAYREIKLSENWYNQNIGALLVFDENGAPMACLPRNNRSYNLYTNNGEVKKVDKAFADKLRSRAYVFYRSLPSKKLSKRDVRVFWLGSLSIADVFRFFVISLITTVTALSIPIISRELYNVYIPLGLERVLLELGALLLGLMVSNVVFTIIRRLLLYRQGLRVGYDFQNAVIHRLFTLPQSFFRRYDSAELAVGVSSAESLAGSVTGEGLSLIMSVFISVIYLVCMLFISPVMSVWGLIALIVYSVVYLLFMRFIAKRSREYADASVQTTAVLTRLIHGIAKLKTSSAEEKAFLRYLKPYIKERGIEEQIGKARSNMLAISLASSGIFALVFYLICYAQNFSVSAGEFIAFVSVFGGLSGYVTAIINSIMRVNSDMPMLKKLEPIFDEEPEDVHSLYSLNSFKHEIKLEHLTFSYGDIPVLSDINLTIKKGEYVALTGVSGCGKSTLLKLMLGFEKPTTGRILYDGVNLEDFNKKLLRKNIGAVLQDSCLVAGSIYDNITVSRPDASLAEVSAAVKLSALEEDIQKMPMGLHTVLGEENSSVSEGQKQRILIARAIITNPPILILDEATSALDNKSQSVVTETLKKSSATKLVAAHRLTTIMDCDRVIVIDKGKVVEQGLPEELLKKGGLFARLAERQI